MADEQDTPADMRRRAAEYDIMAARTQDADARETLRHVAKRLRELADEGNDTAHLTMALATPATGATAA